MKANMNSMSSMSSALTDNMNALHNKLSPTITNMIRMDQDRKSVV